MRVKMNEFDLIDRIRRRAPVGTGVVHGIGDDAAVLAPSPDHELIATTDTVQVHRHFRPGIDAADLGHLALAVNLSDLAAMGATARWCLLAMSLPDAKATWLDRFLDGFLTLADSAGCTLVGGNLARGELSVTVTALGEMAAGSACLRRGARPGDRLVLTGSIGDAAAALKTDAPASSPLGRRLVRPTPRLEAGRFLARHAHAMIDISDGIAADLAHLLGDIGTSGSIGALIHCAHLPASPALEEAITDPGQRWATQLAGGSDYELLATIPPGVEMPTIVGDTPLTEIGEITAGSGIRCATPEGRLIEPAAPGWDHFRSHPR